MKVASLKHHLTTSNTNDDEMFKQNFCPSILSVPDYAEDFGRISLFFLKTCGKTQIMF